jgi:hypothetical protein
MKLDLDVDLDLNLAHDHAAPISTSAKHDNLACDHTAPISTSFIILALVRTSVGHADDAHQRRASSSGQPDGAPSSRLYLR